MKIKYLEISNYGPFKGQNIIQFPDDDFAVYFIQGTYDGDPNKSNRAGKSSFVECIRYLLFGDVRAKKEVSLIHKGEESMYIKGIVTLKGVDVTITRGRTSDNKPIFDIEGTKELLKSAKEKELEELLGYSCADFTATNCIKQGDISSFMQLLPSERKKVILGWFNLDKWKGYEDKAKKKLAIIQAELNTLQTATGTHESQIAMYSPNIKEPKTLQDVIDECKKKLNVTDSNLSDKKAELKNHINLEDTKKKIYNLSAEVNHIEVQLAGLYGKVSLYSSDLLTAKSNISKADELEKSLDNPKPIQEKLEQIVNHITPIQSKIAVAKSEISNKNTFHKSLCQFSGLCPVDKQVCDKGQRIPDYATQILNEINALTTQLEESQKELEKYLGYKTQFNALIEKINSDTRTISLLKKTDPTFIENAIITTNQLVENLTVKKRDISNELNTLNSSVTNDKYNEILKQVTALECERNTLIQQNDKAVTAFAQNEQYIKSVSDLKVKIDENKQKIKSLEEKYYRMLYLCSILNKDGIPSLLIENSISEVEDFTNIILDSISPGFKLEFSTFKELSTKETHCAVCGSPFGSSDHSCMKCGYGKRNNKVKEEIDLKVMTSSLQELEFELDSGGGQVLISLALRLALSKLLSKNYNSNGVLILDEVFGSLDEPNRNLVARLLFNRMKEIMSVNQVFVITHCSLNESSYKKILIKRFDGFSKILLEN